MSGPRRQLDQMRKKTNGRPYMQGSRRHYAYYVFYNTDLRAVAYRLCEKLLGMEKDPTICFMNRLTKRSGAGKWYWLAHSISFPLF